MIEQQAALLGYQTFISQLLRVLHLEDVSEKTKESLTAVIIERINRTINKTVIGMLTEEDLALFEQEVRTGKQPLDVILALVAKKPDAKQKVQNAINHLYHQMVQESILM